MWDKHFREQFENLWNGCGQRHFLMGKKSKSIIQQGFYIYSANPNYEKIGIVGKLRQWAVRP